MSPTPTRAGFWPRYAAYSADATLVFLLGLPMLWPWLVESAEALLRLLGEMQYRVFELLMRAEVVDVAALWRLAQDPLLIETMRGGMPPLLWAIGKALAGFITIFLIWNIVFEHSRGRATPGKRWLRLQVRAADGGALTYAKSLGRFLAGGLSWLSLNLGHACVAWRRDRLALHDLLSKTQVVALHGDAPMPRSARNWLWLQLILLLTPLLWWLLRMLQGLLLLSGLA